MLRLLYHLVESCTNRARSWLSPTSHVINSERDSFHCHTNITGHSLFVESRSILNTMEVIHTKCTWRKRYWKRYVQLKAKGWQLLHWSTVSYCTQRLENVQNCSTRSPSSARWIQFICLSHIYLRSLIILPLIPIHTLTPLKWSLQYTLSNLTFVCIYYFINFSRNHHNHVT